MKTLLSVPVKIASVILPALLLMLAMPVGSGAASSSEPVRIGAVFSLTGMGNFVGPLVGNPMKQAVSAVVDHINDEGGVLGRRIELFVEDDKSEPFTAASATSRLIKEKGVSVVIGPSLTVSASAMASVCEQEQVPLIVTGPAEVPFEKWVFLIGPGETRGAEHMAEFAVKSLKAKRIGVLHDTGTYGTSGNKDLLRSLGSYPGVSVVVDEQFDPSDSRLTPQLKSIKAANPDLLILYTTGASAAIIAKEYNQLGMRTPVLGSHGTSTREFLTLAGSTASAHGWVMIADKITISGQLPPDDPYRRDLYEPFRALLKKQYGASAEPSEYQGVAYDGIMVAIDAIKTAGTDDRAAVRNALERIRWEGFAGAFACTPSDHQGSPTDNSPAVIVRNGAYVPYKK